LIKMQYTLGTKFNSDQNYDALVFNEEPFVVKVNEADLTTSIELPSEDRAKLVEIFIERCKTLKSEIQSAHTDIVKDFPMDTMVPFVSLFYAVQFADKVDFSNDYLQLNFSPDRFNYLKPKQQKLLKAIKGGFYNESNSKGEQALAQVIVDDNLFNAFASTIVSLDTSFSLREYLGNAA